MDKILQTERSLKSILSSIRCNNFEFVLRERKADYSLQIQFITANNLPPFTEERQYCRLWPLQMTMTDTEVVRTAYKAAEAAVLHELEEQFTFRGAMIFCPHTNIHALVELRFNHDIDDVRKPA